MNTILNHLFMCAMEDQKFYFTSDELRDYRAATRAAEKQKGQLKCLLEGESLRLFDLFLENRDEEGNLIEFSSFRRGLAIGLKLGAFYTSEY